MTLSERSGAEPPVGGVQLSPRRLHVVSPILEVLVTARQLLFPLLVLVVGSRRGFIVGPIVAIVVSLVIFWRFLSWTRFSYRIEDGVLRIDEGVLRRARHEVPLARIQQVDLRRQLRHRALGVAVVRIDTAGGGSGAEVTLEAVADAEALALRAALLQHRLATTGMPAAPAESGPGDNGGWSVPATAIPDEASARPTALAPPGASTSAADLARTQPAPPNVDPAAFTALRSNPSNPIPVATEIPAAFSSSPSPGLAGAVVAQIGTRYLVLAGITGTKLFAGLTVVGGGFALLGELPGDTSDSVYTGAGSLLTILPLLLILIPVLVAGFLAAGAAASVLRDHGYLLVRYGPDLHLRRGLLDQREATLAVYRIQAVRVIDNPVRRRLGMVSVQLQSAGSGSKADGEVSLVTVPLVRIADLDRLLSMLGVPAGRTALVPAPRVARRRARVRALFPIAVAVVVALAVTQSLWALSLAVLAVPMVVLADLSYRALGHLATPTHIVTRWGGIVRHTVYVPVAKTQSVRILTSVFQRRVDLATLHIDVAGHGHHVAIRDGDAALLRGVRHGALVAPVARLDERATRRRTHAGVEA